MPDDDSATARPYSPENRAYRSLGLRWLAAAVSAVVALGVLFGVLGLAFGWFDAVTDVVSPENVKTQYRDAYTGYEALKATAGDICAAKSAVAAETDQDAKSQRVSEELAYEQNYRRIAASFDAAYDDAFRAEHVGPGDLPNKAPDLASQLAAAGCH
jgi:hypothetical protein